MQETVLILQAEAGTLRSKKTHKRIHKFAPTENHYFVPHSITFKEGKTLADIANYLMEVNVSWEVYYAWMTKGRHGQSDARATEDV